jgi:hypothetical protein
MKELKGRRGPGAGVRPSLIVNGDMGAGAVRRCADPKPEAGMVYGRVTFGNAVKVAA